MTASDTDASGLPTGGSETGRTAALGDLAALRGVGVDVELARRRLRGCLFGEVEPTRVGRYEVERLLGTGGTGAVFRGHDPELDRAVALKILRPVADGDSLANARLVREAQTIARLAHPNIVAVFEVGNDDGRIFVAMEHVDGVTLRAWLREGPRPLAEVLAVMLQAGRGLAAGHAAGVVHRDFKPENAMLGADGRVRVLDFGLARGTVDAAVLTTPVAGTSAIDTSTLTPAGVVAGTPAYMAPERLWGDAGDARSDQFEFCVALCEAIWGRRPFAGATIGALRGAMAKGHPELGPARGEPRRLRAIVRRGLMVDPMRRWPDMPSLLDALERAGTSRRVAPGLALAAVGVAVVAGVGVSLRTGGEIPVHPCLESDGRVAAVWDDGQRRRVNAAFGASGAAGAELNAREVDAGLVRYLDRWRAQHAAACDLGGVTATQNAAIDDVSTRADIQLACLDARLADVRALVEIWSGADAEAVMRAPAALADLEPLDRCAELDPLHAASRSHLAAGAALLEPLARVKALRAAGRWADGLAIAEPLLQQAIGIGHGPTTIEIRRLVALLHHDGGAFAQAEATTAAVYADAFASRQDRAAFEAALELVTLIGDRGGRHDEALLWGRRAEAVLDVGTVVDDDSRGRLQAQIGLVLYQRGELETALATQQGALALLEQADAMPPIIIAAHCNLGLTLRQMNRVDDARAHYRQAHTIAEAGRASGEINESELAQALHGIGTTAYDQGRFAEAEVALRQTLAIRERVLDSGHVFVAATADQLGLTLVALGRVDEALILHERAVAMTERAVGTDHTVTSSVVMNLAGAYRAKGDRVRAKALVERSLAIAIRAMGRDHAVTVQAMNNLAWISAEMGDHATAISVLEEVIEIQRRTLRADDARVAETEAFLAQLRGAPPTPTPPPRRH